MSVRMTVASMSISEKGNIHTNIAICCCCWLLLPFFFHDMPLNFIEHIDIRMWGSGLREVHGIILIQIILNLKVNARSEFSDHRESYTLRVTQVAAVQMSV